ncbi:MAG: YcxB family protein [Flavobacteriales bacterium]|nr:YcxB family protein [Flavobacteriales bacterium]
MPLVFFVVFTIQVIDDGSPYLLIVPVVLTPIWIYIAPKRITRKTLKSIKKVLEKGDNSNVLGTHHLTLEDDKLTMKYPGSTTTVEWDKMHRLEQNEDYYFLYHSALNAFIIPKEQFQDKATELEEMFKLKIVS